MKSSPPDEAQKPLGPPIRPGASTPSPDDDWRPYGPNPALEINSRGHLRTRLPLPPLPPFGGWPVKKP